MELLQKWQRVHRIVGSGDPDWVVDEVILDSLLFCRVLGRRPREVLDLGSGAGVPGIPLRIVWPTTRLTMIEARRRRASFLSTAVRELGLEGTRVIADRAEGVVAELEGRFDAVVMRCAAAPEELMPLACRFVAPGGTVVASAGPDARQVGGADVVTVPGRGGARRTFLVARPTAG